jgi:FdrA protein
LVLIFDEVVMIVKNIIQPNRYADSVFLMDLANRATQLPGILEASALMGTPENIQLLRDADLVTSQGESARPDDLIIALRAESQELAEQAEQQIQQLMAERLTAIPEGGEKPPRTLNSALDRMPDANLVLISLPGQHVAWEAQAALEAGRHLMIFSDNVPVEEEVALKAEAAGRDLMVMGPDCGTAILGGKVLGFGNVVRPGSVGIVGASGTGIQEACSLLDRFGEGISHAIGLGGRDLSAQVKGAAALQAVGLLEADPGTDLMLFISKPPDRQVAESILRCLSAIGTPCAVCFQGQEEAQDRPDNIVVSSLLSEAVMRVLQAKGKSRAFLDDLSDFAQDVPSRISQVTARLKDEQHCIRGLFSGGSLCAEAGVMLRRYVPHLSANISLPGIQRLEEGASSGGHVLLDLGADEFTVGVPHPMIDFTVRNRRLIREAGDPQTAVILFDIVLGYGAHPDPAGAILPAVLEGKKMVQKRGGYLCCVASLCGTRGDPQGLEKQRRMLEKNGVLVFPSAALAARCAAQVALRSEKEIDQPEVLDPGRTEEKMNRQVASLPNAHLLSAPLKVVNLGLSSFADSLRQQEVPVLHVDWRPPASGDQGLLDVLRKLR